MLYTFDQATSERSFTKAKKLMGIFSKFKSGFKRGISNVLQDAVGKVVGRGRLEESDLLDLEEAFYQSDFGVETTEEIIERIREAHRHDKNFRGEDANTLAREILEEFLMALKVSYLKNLIQSQKSFV